jgi:hypothetical protein
MESGEPPANRIQEVLYQKTGLWKEYTDFFLQELSYPTGGSGLTVIQKVRQFQVRMSA